MLLKLSDPKSFSEAVAIMSELVTELKIKVNKNGLNAVAVDPANVALVSMKIPHSAFSQFESAEEELCVNLDDLRQILKRAGPGSELTLEKKENKLVVGIKEGNTGEIKGRIPARRVRTPIAVIIIFIFTSFFVQP